jgi:carbohydrate-selective porin OprB
LWLIIFIIVVILTVVPAFASTVPVQTVHAQHRDDDSMATAWEFVEQSYDMVSKDWWGVRGALEDRDDAEMTTEVTYRTQVTPWMVIQPSIQIVQNPGAAEGVRNAIVNLLRFEISF